METTKKKKEGTKIEKGGNRKKQKMKVNTKKKRRIRNKEKVNKIWTDLMSVDNINLFPN